MGNFIVTWPQKTKALRSTKANKQEQKLLFISRGRGSPKKFSKIKKQGGAHSGNWIATHIKKELTEEIYKELIATVFASRLPLAEKS